MTPSISQLDLAEYFQKQSTKNSPSTSSLASNDKSHTGITTPTPKTTTYLFPDFKALETVCEKDDSSFKTVSITGFEIYIVEQWACERKYSTLITSYTGDTEHTIKAGKIKIVSDRSQWSEKLLHFFKEIEDSGAKPMDTEHGCLFITNLSQFPSNLNLLPVQCGCMLDIWESFKVNLNLRRMNCGGRSALLLCSPSNASEDKFRQIYKTHPKVDIMYAATELVTLVQISLVDFKLLDPAFVDGLFCDKTEEKIIEWWNLFGSVYYGITPSDGILGPSTVSAILGFVLSCSFRLDMAGSDLPKEPFNFFSFRINVGKFQKQYNLPRTWYLDPITVEKLFRVTSKTSVSDISKLKKVVKSTVHDISGKASTEVSASQVLTTELEKSIKYYGCSARLEYLWFGKGDLRDIKAFEYSQEQAAVATTSTLRSGVGKIRKLPKRLHNDESSLRSRKESNPPPYHPSKDESKVDKHCEAFEQLHNKIKDEQKCKLLTASDELRACSKRRISFPYLFSEINSDQLRYENHKLLLYSKLKEENILKRSKSFSFIEDSVLKREINPTADFLIDRHKRIELLHSRALKTKNNPKIFKSEIETFQDRLFKLRHQAQPLFTSCDLQSQTDARLHNRMDDIKAIGARLEYEIRVLSTKIRDTEDSVDSFVKKVNLLEIAINDQITGRVSNNGEKWYSRIFENEKFWLYLEKLQQYSFFKWLNANWNVSLLSKREANKGNDMKKHNTEVLSSNVHEKLKQT